LFRFGRNEGADWDIDFINVDKKLCLRPTGYLVTIEIGQTRQPMFNILLIPGTSSLAHLRENMQAAGLVLTEAVLAQLDAIGPDEGRH
jgi:hypothetical protein